MVSGRGRFSVIFLALAAIMFCLALVLTPSSRAQNQDNSATAVAGGGKDCVDFGGQDNGTGTGQDTSTDGNEDTTGTSEDNTTDASDGTGQSQQNGNQDTNSDQQTQQDGNQDSQQTSQTRQTQSQDGNQDSEPGDIQQSLETGSNGDQQSQQDGNEDTSSDQQAQDGNQDTSSDQQTQQDGNQDSQQAQGQDGNNECVIASSVPEESLLPTGAPAKSNAKETTTQEKSGSGEKQGNSDRDGKQSDRGGEQTKTEGGQKPKSNSGTQKKTSSGDKKLEIQDHGKKIEIPDRSGKAPRQEKPQTPSKSAPAAAPAKDVRSEPAPTTDLAPRLAATKWTRPSNAEIAATDKPRRFTPDANSEMTLSVRAMGLYDVPVANSDRLEDLDKGLVRMPKTSQPWDSGRQRNVYIAGHYLGQPDTKSRLVFYNLDELKTGDELVLKDGQGRPYKYRVSEKFATGPEDSWVMGQVRGRDMVTLQTCIPPDFGKRLVVRADRVRT